MRRILLWHAHGFEWAVLYSMAIEKWLRIWFWTWYQSSLLDLVSLVIKIYIHFIYIHNIYRVVYFQIQCMYSTFLSLCDYGCFVVRSLSFFLLSRYPLSSASLSLFFYICLISAHVLFLVHYEIVVIHKSYTNNRSVSFSFVFCGACVSVRSFFLSSPLFLIVYYEKSNIEPSKTKGMLLERTCYANKKLLLNFHGKKPQETQTHIHIQRK